MKKRVLPLLLCVAMLLSMVPGVLAAEIPEVTGEDPVAEQSVCADQQERIPELTAVAMPDPPSTLDQYYPQIAMTQNGVVYHWQDETEKVPENLPAGVSYAKETHTLTLQNATLSALSFSGFVDVPITIKVIGDNTIASVSSQNVDESYTTPLAIWLCNNVTFTGGGTLNLVSTYTGEPTIITSAHTIHQTFMMQDVYSYNKDTSIIPADRGSKLTFDGVTIDVNNMIQESSLVITSEGDSGTYDMIWVSKANSVKRAWQYHQASRIAGGWICIAGGTPAVSEPVWQRHLQLMGL